MVVHPLLNQTAAYGESVDFQCRVSSCDDTLSFLVNGRGVEHLNLSAIYYRESSVTCELDQLVATLSIIVNKITLEAIKYISCNLTVTVSGELQDISSNRAYIVNITNPYEPPKALTLPKCVTECPTATECENSTELNVTTNAAHKEQLLMAQLMIIVCAFLIL